MENASWELCFLNLTPCADLQSKMMLYVTIASVFILA